MDHPKQRAALLRDPNFRWMLGGGAISVLGDQFTMIALPWLVLKLTGDALALGMVVALMSVPRAVLILFGGALVDRYSPKQVQ
jgi:MFS family permease